MSGALHDSLRAWAARKGLDADRVPHALPPHAGEELRTVHTPAERRLRLAAWAVLSRLPYAVYRPVTTAAKAMRGGTAPTDAVAPAGAYQAAWEALVADHPDASPPLTVCITHDVDTSRCQEFWPDVLAAEDARGLVGSWNVLTTGPYRLDRGWLAEVRDRGHEIGLHGDTHDAAIGFRTPARIRERLGRCLDAIGEPVAGYRAPALGVSEELLAILVDLGFAYDSSSKGVGLFRSGAPAALPYRHPACGIWELPLAVTDDALFRDWALDDDAALALVTEHLDRHAVHGGLVVVNSHPVNLEARMSFYERLLDRLCERRDAGQVEVVRPDRLVAELQAG